MAWLRANGVRISCERRGEGGLLCLTGTGADFRKTPTILDMPLAERFDVATFDQRGLGRTEKPAGLYPMADYAEDALGVLDALGWKRVHVSGSTIQSFDGGHMFLHQDPMAVPAIIDFLTQQRPERPG